LYKGKNMKAKFLSTWKRSVQPRRQRKYAINAPLHIKREFCSSHLSKELRKKYGRRSITVRKGDKVKVMRGSYKGHSNKIEKVDIKKGLIYIAGVDMTKKEGTKVFPGIHPSNVMITELNTDDKKRLASIDRGKKKK
jgi:large subunit ribosomal protein L24